MKETEKGLNHWDRIYSNNSTGNYSWTEINPETSMDFITGFNLPRSSSIIDVGGGDSRLVDRLLDEGFRDITVLDISAEALRSAQKRLGEKASYVNWVVSDITGFVSEKTFDLWHDRATFHFMTTPDSISGYLGCVKRSVRRGGFLTIGTFSEDGPTKCSGLDIRRYSEETLSEEFEKSFHKLKCIKRDHITPAGISQNFLYCSFRRVSS